ncbi:MAG TPA: bacillithiol system redox-active protein YtxJ [Chryseolinea sp.]
MKWSELKSPQQVDQILEESKEKAVLIFKHSTRCSVSRMALDRLERNWNESEMGHLKPYFLDLINYRDISNRIADQFQVEHESPQVLIIEKGAAVYDESHMGIDYRAIRDALKN